MHFYDAYSDSEGKAAYEEAARWDDDSLVAQWSTIRPPCDEACGSDPPRSICGTEAWEFAPLFAQTPKFDASPHLSRMPCPP